MGYLASRRGDYLSSARLARSRGQFLPSIISGGLSIIRKIISKPAVKAVSGAIASGAVGAGISAAWPGGSAPPGSAKVPGMKGRIQRFLPGGQTGYYRRRRMNPANPKALKRAIRREQGFIKLARRTLKGTGYSISRRGIASKKGAFGRKR